MKNLGSCDRLMALEIRPERPTDITAISTLITEAFKAAPHSSFTEARIVEGLRRAHALSLSLVAVDQGEVIGHVAASPVVILSVQGSWYGLGPISVRPNRQNLGVGQRLVETGLEQLRSLGAAGCVVLGDPAYYHRFGFTSDPALTYGGRYSPYFQYLILSGPSAHGDVAYHPAFAE